MTGESSIAVEAVGLGKKYLRASLRERTLFQAISKWVRSPYAREPVWAVRDVNLRLDHGEALGIIGPNGAGKSTLLLLLAGIVEPTEGSTRARGRIGTFLQLGSGLQPELGVLDNIRLAAALLGMTPGETRDRLEAIVDFGELEPYLGARLGELSSGFQARVAFSTALHADIDVYMVDEVLSVGDADFIRKCLAKMEGFRKEGKTMVIASHSMDLMEKLCTRVLYLEAGRLAAHGAPRDMVAQYQRRHGEPR